MLGACQSDKDKTSDKSKDESDFTEKDIDVKIPSNGKTDTDLSEIKTLEQEELIPFLKQYGVNNTETKVTVSTKFGDFKMQLFAGPKLHRANFIRLAKLGYFDTTVFHRVSEDFVVQGGNSDRQATHDFRNAIGDFLIPNEFKKIHRHNYGAVSAAKYSEQNVSNASSPFEFFVVTAKQGAPHLDDDHTVFGRVTEGMDVVEKINSVKTDDSEWPLSNIEMKITVSR